MSSMQAKRWDIQILRGYAVLVVVLYHAGLDILPAGFVGVDVFFVISGFLITGIVRRDIDAGIFSLSSFYARRARRLLPAAYVTLLFTLLAAPWLLTIAEYYDFAKEVIGALTFTANYVLKNQIGYFEGAADLKPLLHMWSLSVEEQFYFLIPPLLLFMPRRAHPLLFIGLLLLSLTGSLMAKANPETIFYTLPYRAWELALGALVAQWPSQHIKTVLDRIQCIPIAMTMLIVLPLLPVPGRHAIHIALIANIATCVILLMRPEVNRRNCLNRWLVRVGNLSYCLYLIHWPLFSFFNNALIQPDTYTVILRAGLIVTAFVLAYLLHRYIESPFLNRSFKNHWVFLCSVMFGLALMGLLQYEKSLFGNDAVNDNIRRPNIGLGPECVGAGPLNISACQSDSAPQYLVWGDSMAMQLVNGLLKSRDPDVKLLQATRHACPPFIGVARFSKTSGTEFRWELACMSFNDGLLETIHQTPSIKTVILSGNLMDYLTNDKNLLYRNPNDGTLVLGEGDPKQLLSALARTIDGIRAEGRRVVFVSTPPSEDFDSGRCLERKESHLPRVGGDIDCRINQKRYRDKKVELDRFLLDLKIQHDVDAIGFDQQLCDGTWCLTNKEGVHLYRDEVHLSNDGAMMLIKTMGLIDEVDRKAR